MSKLITHSRRLNLQTIFTVSAVLNLARMSSSAGASCPADQQPAKPAASYSLSYVTIDSEENATKLAK